MTLTNSEVTRTRYIHSWVSTALVGIILVWSWVSVVRDTWRPAPAIDRWTIADWVINFQAGPIRRGLLGEVIYRTSADSQMAAYVVVAIQLALLASLCLMVFLLFLKTSRSPTWVMLVLSPAFLLFPLLSYQGGLRKELLVLVALALTALLVSRNANFGWFVAPMFLFLIAAFSHETAALSLPAFLFLFWQAGKSGRIQGTETRVLTIVWSVIAAGALLSALAFPGTTEQGEVICESWLEKGSAPEACAGAISVIGQSIFDGFNGIASQFPSYAWYFVLAGISLLPFVFLRVPKEIWILVAATYTFMVPLFLTGIDYGRWIYLATGLISITVLGLHDLLKIREIRVPLVVAALYILVWSLPYTGPLTQEALYEQMLIGPLTRFNS